LFLSYAYVSVNDTSLNMRNTGKKMELSRSSEGHAYLLGPLNYYVCTLL